MSTARTSGEDQNPNRSSPAAKLPSGAPLSPGSFVDATATVDQGTPEKQRMHRSSDGELASENSNGGGQSPTPSTPTNTAPPAGALPRRVLESPDWLPPGWVAKGKVRATGVTAGSLDRYYYDPVSGLQFRSKKEVLYFIETGTKRKRAKIMEDPSADTTMEGSGDQKRKTSATKTKCTALKFDFHNVPEKVNWVLTDSSQGSWAPFIGDEKVPDSVAQEWAAAFTAVNSRHDSQMMF